MSGQLKLAIPATIISAGLVLFLIAGAGSGRCAEARNRRPKLLWKSAAEKGSGVKGLMVAPDGTIYARTWGGNKIYALAPDGTLRRTLTERGGVGGLAVGNDGTIYVGEANGAICTGGHPVQEEGNSVNAGCHWGTIPEGFSGAIEGVMDSNVYAFAPDGALRWKFEAWKYGLDNAPLVVLRDGTVYVGGQTIYSLTPDGVLRKKFVGIAGNGASLTAGKNDGAVYAWGSYDYVYAFTSDGNVKKSENRLKFTLGTVALISSLPVGRDDTIYVGLNHRSNNVCAIDPETGAIKWSFKAKGGIHALAMGNDGTVYAGSYDDNIYALDPESGALEWRFPTGSGAWGSNPVLALAVGRDGTIYAGSRNSVEAISPP